MAKAILVMDMPDGCYNCPLVDSEWGICLGLTPIDCKQAEIGKYCCADYGSRQKRADCPLIPEPKRQLNSAQHVIGESQKTGKDPKLIGGYHMGWNACLDALEGR